MNLQDLIQSCKTADRKAQKTLFDKFSKTFLRLSFRYLNDRQYAEDACLEAFALIFENIQKFDYQSDAQAEAWMKRIVVNQSLKILRKTKTLLYQQITDDDFTETNEIELLDLLKKVKIDRARLYVQGYNLYTWSKWTGFDSEFINLGSGNNGAIPQPRTITFGLQLGL